MVFDAANPGGTGALLKQPAIHVGMVDGGEAANPGGTGALLKRGAELAFWLLLIAGRKPRWHRGLIETLSPSSTSRSRRSRPQTPVAPGPY